MAATDSFVDFTDGICRKLDVNTIMAMLEPFDRTVDKKFLLGPIDECVSFIDRVKKHDNSGIELDMAHLPLMDEDFISSIRWCGARIKRVHRGNCVKKDKTHPLFGDMHPPMGLDSGEIGLNERKDIVREIKEIGFLPEKNRKPLIVERTPFPGKRGEETITRSFDLPDAAWARV